MSLPFGGMYIADSSPPTRGRRAKRMRQLTRARFIPSHEGQTLSVYAAFSRLKHLVVQFAQMPFLSHSHIQYAENSAAFSFFSNYFFCFSTPITRDIPAPYDLDRPTPFLIRFRNAFASLTRSRNSYSNTLTG